MKHIIIVGVSLMAILVGGCGSSDDNNDTSTDSGADTAAETSSGGSAGTGGGGTGGSAGTGGGGTGGSAGTGGGESGGSAGTGGGESGGSGGDAGSGGSGGTGGSAGWWPGEAPSCDGLAKVCGKDGNTSCCSSPLVPGGTFPMGRSEKGTDKCPDEHELGCSGDEKPEHDVTVSDFYLDEFEVTVGRFRKFLEKYDQEGTKPKAGAGAHPKIPGSGWQAEWDRQLYKTASPLKVLLKCNEKYHTWRDVAGETEQLPINCVTWYEAFAFCAWDGGRLPTEAEWEYAAAGGNENRLYPWGSAAPDKTRASYDCLYDGSASGNCLFADIAKVGMLPAGQGRWGHKDLAGNVWEWVLDWYDADWYSTGGKECTDCANLTSAFNRVEHGGGFTGSASWLRGATRSSGAIPTERRDGFRCARNR